MQIVINIDDEDYDDITLTGENTINLGVLFDLREAVRNGVPLPKGHGRLIDADAFISLLEDTSKRQKYKELLIDDYLTVDDVFKAVIESLQNKELTEGDALTIIEADEVEE